MSIVIPIYVESRYKVNRKRIRKAITDTLGQQQVEGPVELSVAIVGDRKMRELNKKYRDKDKTTNVLSFSLTDGESMAHQADLTLRLGDVIVSYPEVIREASEEDVLVDEKIDELVSHGVLHLLGIHHEE